MINKLKSFFRKQVETYGRGFTQTNYNGTRDLNQSLGYPEVLTYEDYVSSYERDGMSKALVDIPVSHTWRDAPSVHDESPSSEFELAWKKLVSKHNLLATFERLDRLASLGHYAVLVMGFNDNELLHLTPVGEGEAQIINYNLDKSSPDFGMPAAYTISIAIGTNGQSIIVKSSDCIHVVQKKLKSKVFGVPWLQSVYNRLLSLELLTGGSAEMFWRGAFPGLVASLRENSRLTDEQFVILQSQLSGFVNNLQRWLYVEGMDVNSMSPQVASPLDHSKIQIEQLSAASRIPQRILMGSERGELASSQDERSWGIEVNMRRKNKMTPDIIRPFIDKMIAKNVLPEPQGDYIVDWPNAISIDAEAESRIGLRHAEALAKYDASMGARDLMPPEVFLERELGMTKSEVREAMELTYDIVQNEDLQR